jgi:hypothetical protein
MANPFSFIGKLFKVKKKEHKSKQKQPEPQRNPSTTESNQISNNASGLPTVQSNATSGGNSTELPPTEGVRGSKFGLIQLEQKTLQDATAGPPQKMFPVDIVALHGITGDAYDTWTAADNKVLWLRDFLLEDLPGARVFTYGYDAAVFFTKAAGNLDDFATALLESLKQKRLGPVGDSNQ